MFKNSGSAQEQVVTEDEYILFCNFLEKRFGIKLKGGRSLVFHMKVSHRLAILGIETYQQYYDYLASDPEGTEPVILFSHVANHATRFFRDRDQLQFFSSELKEIAELCRNRKKNNIRILSAGSGTGEEVYTLNAIVRSNGLCSPQWDVKIIGVDIDHAAMSRAQEGRYGQNSFAYVADDKNFISDYFIPDGDRYAVKHFLRENIEFRSVNLVDGKSYSGLGLMDIIFCRHVLENMTESGIQRAVQNLFNILSDDGYLFIGTSESIIQHTNLFVPRYRDGMTVYRKNLVNRLDTVDAMNDMRLEAK